MCRSKAGLLLRSQELDQMLAPIALYPDSLLSQILMASSYPLEVVEAARWVQSQSQPEGGPGGAGGCTEFMDPSVKIARRISTDPHDDGR